MIPFRQRAALRRRGSPAGASQRSWLLAASLLCLASGASAALADAEAWLARMDRALTELDYVGEFSYVSGGDLTTLHLVHAVVDGETRERLVHLDGAPREILRRGDEVICVVEPGDEMLALSESIPAGPFARSFGARVTRLPDRYTARLGDVGRVARRPAQRIDVVPVDDARYGYRLWLDEATGLLLRSELRDVDGEPLEIFQFVRVEVGGPIPDRALEPVTGGASIRHRLSFAEAGGDIGTGAGAGDDAGWQASWLPPGFAMTAADVRRMKEDRARSVRTLRYSDGIASFSVFVEPTWGEASWSSTRRRGATSAVMREIADDDANRFLVTVVGEVPLEVAVRVASGVRPAR